MAPTVYSYAAAPGSRPIPAADDYASASRIIAQALTPDVLAALELLFPDRCPDLKDEMKHIYFKAGQASVVRTLRGLYETEETHATVELEL